MSLIFAHFSFVSFVQTLLLFFYLIHDLGSSIFLTLEASLSLVHVLYNLGFTISVAFFGLCTAGLLGFTCNLRP